MMVIKCANPKCSLPFGYQYVGRVFRLRLYRAGKRGELRDRKTRVEYFWLCASCSSAFTLVFDERRGVSLAPFHDIRDHPRNAILIFDISTLRSPVHSAEPKGVRSKDRLGVPIRKHRGRG
jgi:hypothetical protein